MSDGVEACEEQPADAHLYVERLAQIPINDLAYVVAVPQPRREPSAHAE